MSDDSRPSGPRAAGGEEGRRDAPESLQDAPLFRSLAAAAPDSVLVVNGTGTVVFADPTIEDLLGFGPEELAGRGFRSILADGCHQDVGSFADLGDGAEICARHADGRPVALSVTVRELEADGGEFVAGFVRERPLPDEVLETAPVGVMTVTPSGDVTRANERAEDIFGLPAAERDGRSPDISGRELSDSEGRQTTFGSLLERVCADGERVREREVEFDRSDDPLWLSVNLTPATGRNGAVEEVVVTGMPSSDRGEHERGARRSDRRLEQIAENINSVIWMTDAEMSEVLYINSAYESLTGRSRESAYEDPWNHFDIIHPNDRQRVADEVEELQTPDDGQDDYRLQAEYRIVRPDGSIRWVSSSAFPLRDEDGDVYRFVGVIDDITEVKEQQRELGRHRDELETLDQINTVIREINQGVVKATTRREIEEQVCETLAGSVLYAAAWLGEVGGGGKQVTRKTSAGFGTDLLDEADTEMTDDGPIATAVRTEEIQVSREAKSSLSSPVPGTESFLSSDEPFVAAIPLVYRETVYDVLVVYSARPNAFSAREQTILAELGETIGLAINSVQRKKALVTDSVVEVEFRVDTTDHFLVEMSAALDATFELQGMASQSEGSYLQYFSASGTTPERLVERAEDTPEIDRVRVVEDSGEPFRAEFVAAGPSPISRLAEYGAGVKSARFAHDGGTVVAHLPDPSDVRTAVEVVQETCSGIELAAKRERNRAIRTDQEFRTAVEERLTDRQRSALEAAYFGGFFDWPRESSGEEVACSLDISPSTFHQHIRTAERKLVGTLLEERASA